MTRRLGRYLLLLLAALALAPSPASADIAPPWCGTPTDDAAASLPDGTNPSDPAGSFPHIPYYAIGCTLADIESRSDGRMTVEVIGESALGRPMYSVVINELETRDQRKAYNNWRHVRQSQLDDPARAQDRLDRVGDEVKMPVIIQGGIHGNEYEGVDAAMLLIEKLATTPYGEDPFVDDVLDNLIVVFNPIQNPDGRVAGTRANGNGFDLNRDYLTQSQSETRASVTLMNEWIAPELLDLHGYVTPTLVEATTKPHNPSIEYDLWLKWNQTRIDANEAALAEIGKEITRPINDWCSNGNFPPASGICPDGSLPGPEVAEGWDDWGPFYTAMFAQHIGLDSSTVEMCSPNASVCGGRVGSRQDQTVVSESTLEFVAEHRAEMLHDQLEIYIRGDTDAPRPECCPAPFDVDNNWMLDYPQAYVIPMGAGQRSDAEANRLVEWLLFNGIEVSELKQDTRYGGQVFERGSYVVWMAQPRRGLADTALSIGVDISDEIGRLYASPAAWSHGYLWGADTVTIPDGAAFAPRTNEVSKTNRLDGGTAKGGGGKGKTAAWALEIDSPTAVRTLNSLLDGGVAASLALAPFSGGPAGTAVFTGGKAAETALNDAGRTYGVTFTPVTGALPALDPIEGVPAFRVITGTNGTGSTDQSTWVLRELGFTADPVTIQQINDEATNPLAGYDVVFNAVAAWPPASRQTARDRLSAFFAGGGGYVGALTAGAGFLTTGGQVSGLTAVNRSGNGRSGIVYWNNTGGAASVITGAYPATDTMIVDPPTWLTSVPSTMTVDARLPAADFFAAGLWLIEGDAQSASASGAAIIAHGTNTANTARLTVFANNPLYRADPEREWPMVANAAYWGDGN